MSDKLIIQGVHSAYKEPLKSVLFNTFNVQFEKNNQLNINFNAYDDNSIAFSMLSIESSVFWDDQEYIIKQITPDYSSGISTIQVTAIHVGYEIGRIRQRTIKAGTLTYSINDVLDFVFKENKLGFTWQVIGNFDKQQITDLGNCSGTDALSTIMEQWPTAVFWPDNKCIRIYEHDTLAKNIGNRIDYLNNTKEIQLSFDSTSIVNQAMCYGKQKDNSGDKVEYYFEPFLVEDSKSVSDWGSHPGEDISDERFTDVDNMKKYALTQLSPEPSLSISVIENGNEEPTMCEMRRLEIRNIGYVTTVEVVQYQYYPLDNSQPTTITLNNTVKTFLQYSINHDSQLKKSVSSAMGYINNLKQQTSSIEDGLNISSPDEQEIINDFVGGVANE